MLDAILETWRTHEAINRYMLDNIPEAELTTIPLLKNGQPGKGRDVARQFAHIVDVRVAHVRAQEKAYMKAVRAFDKGASPPRPLLEASLEATHRTIAARSCWPSSRTASRRPRR